MTIQRIGFRIRTVYTVRKPKVLAIARQKLSFMVATLSLVAFVAGNMVGQNGWYAFWKTVLGAEDDATIMFVGTVSPIAKIPDYQKWAAYGGSKELHMYHQAPKDVLQELPVYNIAAITGESDSFAKQVYSSLWSESSHPGIDIDAPRGTPVVSMANGVVEKVSMQTNGFGHYVMIRHPNVPDASSPTGTTTLYSTYAHLDTILVTEGTVVHKGQNIGTVGNTGRVFGATGYHLHFQIDVAEAPFHPYWPFSSTEIAAAGMSYTTAVNSTEYRDRLVRYTMNPMLFVEKYKQYVPPVMVAGKSGETVVSSSKTAINLTGAERLKYFASERARERIARSGLSSSTSRRTLLADLSSSVVSSVSASLGSTNQSSSSSETAIPESSPTADPASVKLRSATSNSEVDHLTIEHSGKISHTWQKVSIRAVDRNGDLISSPVFGGRLYVISEFGDATIRPSELSPLDFVNGIASVNVLARTNKTLFISTRGAFTAISAPMVMDR